MAQLIVPHEPSIRRWIRSRGYARFDEDDLVQESYSRMAVVPGRSVLKGRAYFFRVVRNLIAERLRRDKVVPIEALAEINAPALVDEAALPDRCLSGREQLALVRTLIDQLPPRCRQVLQLRRLKGLSQRQTAEQLNLSESVVEKEIAKGLRLVLERLKEFDLDLEIGPNVDLAAGGPATYECRTTRSHGD